MSKINKVVVKGVSYDIEDAYARLKVNNLVKHVAWNDSSRLNDFTTAGVYEIKGERTMSREYDNLPIENSGSGHTISARLEVLDSSINDTTNSDDKCITQKLTLSNRVGGDGNVYIRTGRGRTYDSITWEKWGILQTNINVGQVGSLDEFVDNGIYSGVWTDGSSFAQTFVMVVINDYAVAGANKTIVQYKYAYDTLKGNGEPTYNTRSLHNGEWSDWEDVHDDDLNVLKEELLNAININKEDIANNSIAIGNEKYRAINAEKTLQKNIDNTNKIVGIEEKKKLSVYIGAVLEDGSTYLTSYSAYTNAFEGGDIAVTNGGYYINDVRKVSADGVAEMVAVNSKRLCTEKGYTYQLNISKDSNGAFSNDELEGIVGLYNYEGGDTSELEQKIEKHATDIQNLFEEAVKFDSFEVEELGDGIGINFDTFNGHGSSIEIPFATEEKAGVMSAEDKKALATNAPNLALRALFLAAGAEYNDTDQIIQKTAPWETEEKWRLENDGTYTYWEEPAIVEHLPKHYYLNGLGDITEEQMVDIYSQTFQDMYASDITKHYRASNNYTYKFRTNLRSMGMFIGIGRDGNTYLESAFYGNTFVQVVVINLQKMKLNAVGVHNAFTLANSIKHVIGIFKESSNIVDFSIPKLMTINLITSRNVNLTKAVLIYKRCVLYMIQNATPTTAITITLHPDAYARIANQPDIIEALEAQPLITLVSA